MKNVLRFKELSEFISFRKHAFANKQYNKYLISTSGKFNSFEVNEENSKNYSIILEYSEDNTAEEKELLDRIYNNKLLGEKFDYENDKIISSEDILTITSLNNTFSGKIENKSLKTSDCNIKDFTILSKFLGLTDISGYSNKKYQNFFGNTTIKKISLPKSLTEIGHSAFAFCLSLTSITIPSTITSIKTKAFYNCSSLKDITIPSSIKSIENQAFANCSNLTKIIIKSSIPPKLSDTAFTNINENFKIYVSNKNYDTYIKEWNFLKDKIEIL